MGADNDGRNELNRGAELLEDDRGVDGLRDYDWNFAAGQELGLLAGIGEQMRLGKNLGQVMLFEVLEKSLHLVVLVAKRQTIGEPLGQQHWDGRATRRQSWRVR